MQWISFLFTVQHHLSCRQVIQIRKPAEGENVDTAIYVLSRIAGEGADRTADKGDYYLKDEEHQMLADICAYYRDVIVVINAGAQVDLSFMDEFKNIKALLTDCTAGNGRWKCIC